MSSRIRLIAAAMGTVGLLCASTISLATGAQAAAPTGTTTAVRAAAECWSTPGGKWRVTCVSRDHGSGRDCDYARHQKRLAGIPSGACIHNTNMAWGPWFFYYKG
ncbi:hypothetical protein [Tenggerimyces flavus]|uniref:Uncharacterized protein n=1 Tax=Tenggerimyces flavus TaxID=1708749 RepID=A0ABV7YB02_9ACTN|nr:hypothetical protein [Tenggerimyces flavus]MBM7789751.1 hypothetical protein [Tenggerimyces flavus]